MFLAQKTSSMPSSSLQFLYESICLLTPPERYEWRKYLKQYPNRKRWLGKGKDFYTLPKNFSRQTQWVNRSNSRRQSQIMQFAVLRAHCWQVKVMTLSSTNICWKQCRRVKNKWETLEQMYWHCFNSKLKPDMGSCKRIPTEMSSFCVMKSCLANQTQADGPPSARECLHYLLRALSSQEFPTGTGGPWLSSTVNHLTKTCAGLRPSRHPASRPLIHPPVKAVAGPSVADRREPPLGEVFSYEGPSQCLPMGPVGAWSAAPTQSW